MNMSWFKYDSSDFPNIFKKIADKPVVWTPSSSLPPPRRRRPPPRLRLPPPRLLLPSYVTTGRSYLPVTLPPSVDDSPDHGSVPKTSGKAGGAPSAGWILLLLGTSLLGFFGLLALWKCW